MYFILIIVCVVHNWLETFVRYTSKTYFVNLKIASKILAKVQLCLLGWEQGSQYMNEQTEHPLH